MWVKTLYNNNHQMNRTPQTPNYISKLQMPKKRSNSDFQMIPFAKYIFKKNRAANLQQQSYLNRKSFDQDQIIPSDLYDMQNNITTNRGREIKNRQKIRDKIKEKIQEQNQIQLIQNAAKEIQKGIQPAQFYQVCIDGKSFKKSNKNFRCKPVSAETKQRKSKYKAVLDLSYFKSQPQNISSNPPPILKKEPQRASTPAEKIMPEHRTSISSRKSRINSIPSFLKKKPQPKIEHFNMNLQPWVIHQENQEQDFVFLN